MKGRGGRSRAPSAAASSAIDDTLLRGRVVASHGRHVMVELPDGHHLLCHPRGKKSEAIVGDWARVAITDSRGTEGVLEKLEPRQNLLYRQDEWRTKSFAANLDRLLILVAVEPVFSESQLTRSLIAAEEAHIEPIILLNKVDLPGVDGARARLQPYRDMGYEVLEVSLKGDPERSAAELAPRLTEGATLVLGPSGTGKSTLVNLLVPDAQAQTGEISTALNSGRHTTTHTRWYDLPGPTGAALIDSPGFQEFGIHHVGLDNLAHWMADLRPHLGQCRFHNCTHDHEPGCAVRAALEAGKISPSRHRIYLELRSEIGASRW